MLINFLVTKAQAAITNEAVGALGNDAAAAADGSLFTGYFLRIWNAIYMVGGLLVLINFLWGAVTWITGGNDSAKIQKARDRMIQSVIGLIILVSSFALIGFINMLFFGDDFNILNLQFGP
jgi:hypothetical protein